MHENLLKAIRKDLKKPKTNFFFKSIECWKCNEYHHKLVLTEYHGILCIDCYKDIFAEYEYHFGFFESSLECDGLDPNDNPYSRLGQLTELMHDFYESYIIDPNWYNYLACYKESVEFVKEIYETMENNGEFLQE